VGKGSIEGGRGRSAAGFRRGRLQNKGILSEKETGRMTSPKRKRCKRKKDGGIGSKDRERKKKSSTCLQIGVRKEGLHYSKRGKNVKRKREFYRLEEKGLRLSPPRSCD